MNNLPESLPAALRVCLSDRSDSTSQRILLIEDNDSDARFVEALLLRSSFHEVYELVRACDLDEGLACLRKGRYEAVLLDLGLSDSFGLGTVDAVRSAARCAIIVLSGMSDDAVALQAVNHGAQDYLLKDELREPVIKRSIRYAIERYRLLADLNEAKERAEAASEAKSSFLAVMSHEFRTPMNGIIGGLDLLKDRAVDEGSREIHQMMRECAFNQLELINDILDLSRIESGKIEILAEPFLLADLIQSAINGLRLKANSKGIRLTTTMGASLPEAIVADPRRIRQVLMNLIGNAIKFTDVGEVHISVEQGEPNAIEFGVRDTGIGIAPDQLDKVFESFTQVDASYQRRFQGSGLGLAICRRLAEAMGGAISVTSELGEGSTFRFAVPYKTGGGRHRFERR